MTRCCCGHTTIQHLISWQHLAHLKTGTDLRFSPSVHGEAPWRVGGQEDQRGLQGDSWRCPSPGIRDHPVAQDIHERCPPRDFRCHNTCGFDSSQTENCRGELSDLCCGHPNTEITPVTHCLLHEAWWIWATSCHLGTVLQQFSDRKITKSVNLLLQPTLISLVRFKSCS